ncbi:hypothetical protein PVAND_016236 [Polypedilum vanderplanki]|uniref:Uncharacterized protein n=1 Tax=Polypedilum vanderplanki TaxID=319348 RepID=A0A9J6BEH7_POLVA|nr:hypothetical protein PVAND_016236 [Polypedilum vanderplanki]
MKFLALFTIFQIFMTSNSLTINCFFESITFYVIDTVYECSTTNIFEQSSIYVTNINGTHMDRKNNSDVTSVRISGNWILPFVPRNFSNFFSNIKSMIIHYTAIEILFGDEIDEFPELEYFDFQFFYLTTISSRLFEKTPNVIGIWFSYAMIEKVGQDLFTPLDVTKLKWIGFNDNACINQQISNGTQADIILIIDVIRQKCPYVDEFLTTTEQTFTTILSTIANTTIQPSTITTTNSLATTTSQNLFCTDESIEDFICNLKTKFNQIQTNLTIKDDEIDSTLNTLRENLAETNKKLNERLTKSIEKIEALDTKLKKLNEELELKDEKIESIKSEFEKRLLILEDINLNSASKFFILNFPFLISCALFLNFL